MNTLYIHTRTHTHTIHIRIQTDIHRSFSAYYDVRFSRAKMQTVENQLSHSSRITLKWLSSLSQMLFIPSISLICTYFLATFNEFSFGYFNLLTTGLVLVFFTCYICLIYSRTKWFAEWMALIVNGAITGIKTNWWKVLFTFSSVEFLVIHTNVP